VAEPPAARHVPEPAPTAPLVPPPGWLRDAVPVREGCGARYLLLVTGLAALLRLWRLDGMSLWVDEVFTWNIVAPERGHAFGEAILAAYQGPLFHAAAWLGLRWQETSLMLRLPSALAGVAAVPLFGVLVARLWDRRTGRLAALLLALSPFAVWYAQEGRGYSFLILFAIAAGLVLLASLERGPTAGRAAALVVLTFAGLTSNLAFLFLLAAFAATVPLAARPRTARAWSLWAIGLGGGVVLALPWLLAAAGVWEVGRVLPGAVTGDALRGETTFTPWALPFSGHAFFYGFSLGPSLAELHGTDRLAVVRGHLPLLVPAGLLAGAALAWGLATLDRRRWPLLLWIAVPLAAAVLLAVRNVKPFNVRYVAAAFPWVLALAAAGVCRAPRVPRIVLGAGLCALLLASLGGHFLVGRYQKEDVRGALAAIAAAPGPVRPLLVPAVGTVVRHYWRGTGPVLAIGDEPLIRDRDQADEIVARRLAGHDAVWVVWARTWYLDPHGHLAAALQRHGTLERLHAGPGVTVDLWQRRPGVPPEPSAADGDATGEGT
jgi:mannosyltransferase